jgi:hypothetical protein
MPRFLCWLLHRSRWTLLAAGISYCPECDKIGGRLVPAAIPIRIRERY